MKGNIVVLVALFQCLDLIFAQEVKFSPEQATVAVGQTKSVRCYLEPATQADAQYLWYDNKGAAILELSSSEPKYIRAAQGSRTGMLLYIKVADGDQGSYKCKVVVEAEEYEGYFSLETYATITVDGACKSEQHGTKGQEGKVNCAATAGGTPLWTYWERNGRVLDDTSGHYRFDENSLIIVNVTDADKGEYTYVAEPNTEDGTRNSLIPIKKEPIFFDVYEVPVILKPILESSGVAGGDLTLYCKAKAYPVITFSWYKGTSALQLSDTGRIRIEQFGDQSQLQFKPVQKDDAGSYRCKASNAAGDAETSSNIIVHTPPIISQMNNVTARENGGAMLTCDAYGDPRPQMEWVRLDTGFQFVVGDQTADKSVSSGDIGDIGNPGTQVKLEFSNLKHQDAGNYQCNAQNLAGTDSKNVNLQVMFGPNFDGQPDGPFYTWKNNKDGHLPCVVSANPLPVFQWFKGTTEITKTKPFFSITREEEPDKFRVTSKLMITYNGQNDNDVFGEFRCVARNTINAMTRNLTMTKAAAPGSPEVKKHRETATVLELQFLSQGVHGPPVNLFKAVISKTGSTETPRIVTVQPEYRDWVDDRPVPRTTMIIDKLLPSTPYSLTLYAENEVGEGTPVEMKHTTKGLSKPESVKVISNINSPYPSSILVQWNKPYNGGSPLIHYLVQYRQVAVKNTTSPQGGYDFLSPIQNQEWITLGEVLPNRERVTINNLIPGRHYQVQVLAVNNKGPSDAEPLIIKTQEDPNYRPVGGAPRPVVPTIFTLVAALATACFRSFL